MRKNLFRKILLFGFLFSQDLWAFSCPKTVAEANALSDMDYSMAPTRCASEGIFKVPQRTVRSTSNKWTTVKTRLDGTVFHPVKVPDRNEVQLRESKLPTLSENTIVCHPPGSVIGPICQNGQNQVGTRTYKPSPYSQEEVDSMSPLEHTEAVMRGIQQGYSVQGQQVKYKTVKVDEEPKAVVGNGLGVLPQEWSEAEYLRCNPDVAAAVSAADSATIQAAQAAQVSIAGMHYLSYGKKEGRSPSGGCGAIAAAPAPVKGNGLGELPSNFSEEEYLRCNPDVAAAVDAADATTNQAAKAAQVSVAGLHFLMYGKKEGRSPAGECAPRVKAKIKGVQ